MEKNQKKLVVFSFIRRDPVSIGNRHQRAKSSEQLIFFLKLEVEKFLGDFFRLKFNPVRKKTDFFGNFWNLSQNF